MIFIIPLFIISIFVTEEKNQSKSMNISFCNEYKINTFNAR